MAEAIVGGGHGPREVLLVELAGESSRLHGRLLRELGRAGIRARWHGNLEGPGSRPATLPALLQHLAGVCGAAVDGGELPLLLSPDQSATVSAWQGVARAREAHGRIGLILIDARLDAEAPEDGPGIADEHQILPRLLGESTAAGDAPFPCLDPGCVCVVAAREWTSAEVERVSRLGVRVFGLSEVRRRGFAATFCDALSIARSAAGGFVVSLDLSALDERQLSAESLATALHALRECPDLLAFEIARAQVAPEWSSEFAVAALGLSSRTLRALEDCHGAHNYDPLPVVFARGKGVWLWDVSGRRYLDMMSAYSAVSLGHGHPRLLDVLSRQAARLSLTSRAYSNDRLPLLLERLCELFGYEAALPVNTGLEAVETALKAARKWAYRVKGVAPDAARIIACDGNFHGRSIAIVGLSSDDQYRDGFGPFPPGLERIPFGDADALEAAITPQTAAFLVEPIQGEGGIRLPLAGWLARCAEICRRHHVLLIADEVQTGLGRTGKLLACAHEGVRPDGVIVGKALGGGLLPVSAFLADRAVMDVFAPGDHGSTFGGNPLAAAVALETLDVITDENLCEHAAGAGERFRRALEGLLGGAVRDVRGRGLFIGVDLDPSRLDAHHAAQCLLERGILTKDTHGTVLRFAPPLVIEQDELDWAAGVIIDTLERLQRDAVVAG
ncbi:MAG: ornithine--oxo-acid transaminase [Rhodocyclaceae bacterium]|nr:ornithine--oxo-acid transaminase [Rhodocyclaceae bacterium]